MSDAIGTVVTDPVTGATLTKVADPAPAPAPAVPTVDGNLIADAKPPVETPESPKLDADGKPIVEPKLGPDGKPIVETPPITKPEDYKIEALPEGVQADDPLLKAFLDGAAKKGLSNEAVSDIVAELAPKLQEHLKAPYAAWAALQTGWQAEVKADPILGGAKLTETMGRINAGVEKFAAMPGADGKAPTAEAAKAASDAVFDALKTTGGGNNPAIIRLLHNVFSRLGEGTPVVGSPSDQNVTQSAAAKLYDNPASQPPAARS